MKMQHRIISLLLVFSLLLGSLVFTVSADSGSGDAFVPTATLTDITPTGTSTWVGSTDAYVLGGSDADLGSASWTLSNQDFTAHKVTTTDGNTYFQLSAIRSGTTTMHSHFTPYGKNTVTYDANNNNYVVYEMDIGTESTLQATRNHCTSASAGTQPSNMPFISLILSMRIRLLYLLTAGRLSIVTLLSASGIITVN